MGCSSWSAGDYTTRKASYAGKSRQEVFQSRSIRKDFDPKNIDMRESCDSEAHPESTALIFGLDVSGSMGFIAERIAKEGLGTLVNGILDSKPVTDPHLMMMAIGDIRYDEAPLQVTQFETDIKIADQLTELWLEGAGGGNQHESYDLPWAFAATKTKIDCFDKRGVKGYLFTMGDEMPPVTGNRSLLVENGINFQSEMNAEQVLEAAQERYNVFHVIVEEGNYCSSSGRLNSVRSAWNDLLGKRVIHLNNHKHISEVIISVIMVNEGQDPDSVIAQWQTEAIRDSVSHAIYGPNQQQING
jgi:hypothetical protein